MEGNECYHYRTVARYIAALDKEPIKSVLEIGVCLGDVTFELNKIFPNAKINGYEALKQRFISAKSKLKELNNIQIVNAAVTSMHLYEDDLGLKKRNKTADIMCYQAMPQGGGGWVGGSWVGIKGTKCSPWYVPSQEPLITKTLKDALDETQKWTGQYKVDFLKTDCEGSECSFLGAATEQDLKRIRWIAGEYHNLNRFLPVMEKLRKIFRINLVGNKQIGSFFCEDHDEAPGLLKQQTTKLQVYPNLSKKPICWNIFDKAWITRHERRWHGIN